MNSTTRTIDVQYLALEHDQTPTPVELAAIEAVETPDDVAIRIYRQVGSATTRVGTVKRNNDFPQVIEWHDVPYSECQ